MAPANSDVRIFQTPVFGLVLAAFTGLLISLQMWLLREYAFTTVLGQGALVILIIAALAHPLLGFSLYFTALFFAEATIPGVAVSANQAFGILFLLSFASYWLRGKTLPLKFKLLPLLLIASCYYTVNAILGEDAERGLVHARYVVIYFGIAVCLASSLSTERAVLALCWIVVGFTSAFAVYGLWEAFSKDVLSAFAGHWSYAVRVKGTAKNPILYGWHMVFAFPFAFLLFSQLRTTALRLLALALGLLALFAATLTFNRQTYIIIVMVLGLTAVLYDYRNRRFLLTMLAAVGAIAALTVMPLVMKRMLTVANLERDYSYLERRDSVLVGMEMLKQHPVTGIGLGSFPSKWKLYIPEDYSTFFLQYSEATHLKYPDLGYLQILVETGIVGLALFLIILVAIAASAWRLRKTGIAHKDRFAQNYAATVLTLIVFVAVTTTIQDTILYPRVWMVFSMALLLQLLTPRASNGVRAAAAD